MEDRYSIHFMTGKKKTKTKNKEIKTYRLTDPPTNIEQYFD